MFRTMVIALGPERKEKTVKGDRCNLTKDPLMVRSVFFLEHRDGKL